MTRRSWLDDDAQTPIIDRHAAELSTFVEAMADGRIDSGELQRQEARLVAALKRVEPLLDDGAHEAVTELLCEMTAYNIMQTLSGLRQARPVSVFRG